MLVAIALAGAVFAGPVVDMPPCHEGQQRVETAAEELALPVPPGWRVEAICGPALYSGVAHHPTRTVKLWVDVLDDDQLTGVLVHELGHAYDRMLLGREGRETWKARHGIDGDWHESGAVEMFANAFRDCYSVDHEGLWPDDCEYLHKLVFVNSGSAAS